MGESDGRTDFEDAVDTLVPISLDEVMRLADLQVRLDRKYLVPAHHAAGLVRELGGSLAALEIEGRRCFGYESVYFDTPDLLAYRLHARGRPRRFKVRTRTYLDSGFCVVEVKTEGSRGRTVKVRAEHPVADRDRLTPGALDFVHAQLRVLMNDLCADRMPLEATVVTAYSRRTLVDPDGHQRLTLDTDLEFRRGGRAVTGPAGLVLVETKSPSRPTAADHWLRWNRMRPVSVSKYCLGAAALDTTLPASRWSRVLRRHFDWEPQRHRVAG